MYLIVLSPRSKSSKKVSSETTAKTQTVSEPEPTVDYITDSFVGHNSLKAWKLENEKQKKEKSDIEMAERMKKVKSPTKAAGKDSKMAGRSGSKSPPKSSTGSKSAGKKTSSRLGSPIKVIIKTLGSYEEVQFL